MHVDLKLLQDIQCEAPPSRSCWATSSNSLACALGPRSYLFFDFDAHSKVLDSTHQLDEDISALALSPCGTVLLLGTTEGHLLRVSREAIDANTAASTSPSSATEENHIHPAATGTSDRICTRAGAAAGSSAFSSDVESRCPRHGEHCSAESNNITIDLIRGFREEDRGKGKSNIAIQSVACNEEGTFAVARGKHICLVNKAGKIVEVLGPLANEVIAIGWSKEEDIEGGTVVAITCDELCAWHAGDPASNVKIERQGKGLFAGLATSPKNSMVVAYNDQGDVHCWDIDLLMKERSMNSKKSADLLSFGTSLHCQQPVRYLSWDSSGRLLGISDNSTLKIWRRSEISSHTSKSNLVECYKFYGEPPITYFDFALDGQLFASASEGGQTTVYLSKDLQHGEMDRVASIAKETLGFTEAIRGLAWISRNRLIALSEDGRLSASQMNIVEEEIDVKEVAADDAIESNAPPSKALRVSDQKHQKSELQNACHDICDVHTAEEHNSKHQEADGKEVRQDTIAGSVSSSRTPHDERPERSSSVDVSHSLSIHSQVHPSHGGISSASMPRGRTNEPQRTRPLRTQVSEGRKASMNPAKGGGPPRGVSQTLLQHLQNMRESPGGAEHAAALEAQENLTGWGLGYPGGASIPWMSGFPLQPGVLTGQDLATTNVPQTYVSPAHVQYIYTPYGGMPMVPSPGSSPTGFASVPPVGGPSHSPIASPQAMSHYAQTPFYYQHLYHQAHPQQIPHSPRSPPSAVTGGTTLVQPQHPMAPSSAGATSYAMPYSQMHQWAGTAPGYMAYQHLIRPSGSQRSTGSSQGAATHHHHHHASESLLQSGGPEKISGIRGHEANAWSDSSQYQPSSSSPSHASISPGHGDMQSGRKPPFRFEGMRKHLQSEHVVVEPPPGLGLSPKNMPQTGPASLSRKGVQRHACREVQTKNTKSGVGGRTDDAKEQGGPVEEEKTQLRRYRAEEAVSKHRPGSVSAHEVMKQERTTFSEFLATPEPPTPPSLGKTNNKVPSPAEEAAAAPDDETTPKTKAGQIMASESISSVSKTGNHVVAHSQKTSPKSRESGRPDVVHVAQTHLDSLTSKFGDGADDDLEEEGGVMTGEAASTVYLGNLTPAVDEYALAWLSGHFGPVKHVQIIRDKTTHVSRGFGFVTFQHPAYATLAMQQLNGQVMHGPFGGQRLKAAPTKKRD